MSADTLPPAAALLRGLRRAGYEPQLTQALAAVFHADPRLAAAFVRVLVENLVEDRETRADLVGALPSELECAAEETVVDGRLDLRFRGQEWDLIVEVKIHAGYGPEWFKRYLKALSDRSHAYLAAITRDVPLGEPAIGSHEHWLGATRWRSLLPDVRRLEASDRQLNEQWALFFDVLEREGSMGFTKPDPALFHAFAAARLATRHMEEFLRVLEAPLLRSMQDVLGGESGASLYWERGGRFSRDKWGRLDIPFRVPAGGPRRIRAGLFGWEPPTSFFVQPLPTQRWDIRQLPGQAAESVAMLRSKGWDPRWLRKYRALDAEIVQSGALEERVLAWATSCFEELRDSGFLALPVETVASSTGPEEDVDIPVE